MCLPEGTSNKHEPTFLAVSLQKMKFKLSLPKLLVDGDMSSWRNPTTNWPFHHQQRSTFTTWNPKIQAEPRNTEAPPSTGVSPVSVRRPGGVSLEGAEAAVSYWSTRWEHGVVKKMGHTTRIIRKIWQVSCGNIDEKIWGDCLRYPSLYGFGSRPCHLPVQDKFIPRSSQYKLPRSSGKGRKNEWTPLPKSPPFIFFRISHHYACHRESAPTLNLTSQPVSPALSDHFKAG